MTPVLICLVFILRRTYVWLDFCNVQDTLPPPFNLLAVFADFIKGILLKPCSKCLKFSTEEDEVDNPYQLRRKKSYQRLLRTLRNRYMNEIKEKEELGQNNFEQMSGELRRIQEMNIKELNKKIEDLTQLVSKLKAPEK